MNTASCRVNSSSGSDAVPAEEGGFCTSPNGVGANGAGRVTCGIVAVAAAEGALAAYQNEGQSFSPSERAELVRLHAKITGQAKDISAVVMSVEKASLELQLAVQLRNKGVEAYQEIFRMQV